MKSDPVQSSTTNPYRNSLLPLPTQTLVTQVNMWSQTQGWCWVGPDPEL